MQALRLGSYIGTGAQQSILSGPWQPDLVVVKSAEADAAVARTSTMGLGNVGKAMAGAVALVINLFVSLNPDGFTVGTRVQINRLGTVYHYLACRAMARQLALGSYVGNGGAQSITGLGIAPVYVWILPNSSQRAVHASSTMGGLTFFFSADAGATNRVTSFDADGFTVGSSGTVNASGSTYHYVAWAAIPEQMGNGSYVGDGTDNRQITGVGFEPWLAITVGASLNSVWKPRINNDPAVMGQNSKGFTTSADGTNAIQALEPDGFQVGDVAGGPNNNGATIHWAAFRPGESAVPPRRRRRWGRGG